MLCTTTVQAKPLKAQEAEDILQEYDEALSGIDEKMEKQALLQERNQQLANAGYEVYEVNEQTYTQVEQKLKTNLSEIGVTPQHAYTIIVGGENVTRGSAGSSFTYTYNGKTYTMRYLTVKADDDEATPYYQQAATVNLLNSSLKSVIENCINKAVIAYVSYINKPLGTIAAICGLKITDFGMAGTSTLDLNVSANWTRVFTQVWSSSDQAWAFCSCVEYVQTFSYCSGTYYSSKTNRMEKVGEHESRETIYSQNYSDNSWRKSRAAMSYASASTCIYDKTGDVSFSAGDKDVKIFYEHF